MWLLLFVVNLFYLNELQANLANEVQDLTEIFFSNLNSDPFLMNEEFSKTAEDFINTQTENYITLMKSQYGIEKRTLPKRSAEYAATDYVNGDKTGTYIFQGFSPLNFTLLTKNINDLFFIEQNNDSYLLILDRTDTNSLIFQKVNGTKFDVIFNEPIGEVDRILTHVTSSEIFVILTNRRSILIYTIVSDKLKRMQELEQKIRDVIVWEHSHESFLGIIQETDNNTSCESTALVYKWLGKHFDVLSENIITYCAKSMSAASIGNINFLAVANYQYDDGQTRIYSEIFKYNIDTEKYEPHQKILTNGAVDVQFFCFEHNGVKETYLIAANSLKDENHIESNINSIIYKYVDRYFIPFQSIANAAERWTAITGKSGEFLLISQSKTEGIRAFVYDGWRFIESDYKQNIKPNSHFGAGVSYTSSQHYQGDLILKVSNNNFDEGQINLYKLNFLAENTFKLFQNDLLKWCQDTLDDAEVEGLQNAVLGSSNRDAAVVEHEEKGKIRKSRQENYEYSEKSEDSAPVVISMEVLKETLEDQLQEVTEIRADLDNYLRKSYPLSIHADIRAVRVIINKEIFFESNIIVETINGKDATTIMEDLINISEDHDFTDQSFNFATVETENVIEPKHLNGKKFENLVDLNDSIEFQDVVVDGKVTFNRDLKVGGRINGVYLDPGKIVLTEGDQDFAGEISRWDNVKIGDAKCRYLNKIDLREVSNQTKGVTEELDNLRVRKLVIFDKINGVDINALNQHALRINGDQEISANYTFDTLEADDIFLNAKLSGKSPKDAVLVDGREYNFRDTPVLFTGDVTAGKMNVRTKINNLNVDEEGKLNVLLRDAKEEQYISGPKTFEDLKVINPVNLQVKINSERLQHMNPTYISPNRENIVEGNYSFTGNVKIEQALFADDMTGSNSRRTVRDILSKGLLIEEEIIPHHLTFNSELNVGTIQVDSINGLNPDDFVINQDGVLQDIAGNKVIKSDVHITGSTTLVMVNGIHVPTMINEIMYTENEQEIIGNHTVEELSANSVDAVHTTLGDHIWRDIVTMWDNQTLYGTTTINQSAEIKYLKVNDTQIEGLINTYNFTEMLNDTADVNTTEIWGRKIFQDLKVENLTVLNGANLSHVQHVLRNIEGETFRIEKNFDFPDNIQIENMNVLGYMNDISRDEFREYCSKKSKGLRTFKGEQRFDTVTVHGGVVILSNEINGISFTDVVQNTVKTNETFYFDDVTFHDVVLAAKPVVLQGDVVGLDLENVVTCVREEQNLSGLIFADDVIVNGSLEFDGRVNGFDYTQLCRFVTNGTENSSKSLIINGDVHFSKGPQLKTLNDHTLANFYEEIWLANRETTLKGHIEFETLNFESDVLVEGLVNDVDLAWISSNYFSKTKNQTISGFLDFTDGAVFLKGLSAPEVKLPGLISGYNVTEFVHTAILNNVTQHFESPLHIGVCDIRNLYGEYLVNDLNLPNDVMRYDANNIILGHKEIPNIVVRNLLSKENAIVQNVDLSNWFEKSAMKTGGRMSGDWVFKGNVTFKKELGVAGKVNGIKFDDKSILTKTGGQTISGSKTIIHQASGKSAATFETIHSKGTLNDINISELARNKVSRIEDSYIETETNLNGELVAHNLNIEKTYNGINVDRLLEDLSKSQSLNNYYGDYAGLLNVSYKIKESLEYQAFFLDHYDVVEEFNGISDVFYLHYQNVPCLAIVDSNKNVIKVFRWNNTAESFNIFLEGINVKDAEDLTYLTLINLEGKQYLYCEYKNAIDPDKFIGIFLPIHNPEEHVEQWVTNSTRHIHTFTLPNTKQECLIVTYTYQNYLNIYCELPTNGKEWFGLHQQLQTYTTLPVSTITIGSNVYILVVNDEIDSSEMSVYVWKKDADSALFDWYQKINAVAINSISTVAYKNVQYLAVSSGHLQDAIYEGMVQIYRFDPQLDNFVHWQNIPVEAPIQVEFSVVPSDELILYILTDTPTKPFLVYAYEGIDGFKAKFTSPVLSKMHRMKQFTTLDGNNFVVGKGERGVTLLRSYFKGHRER